MAWNNVQLYNPDANIAKEIGNGGIGGFATSLGAGMNKLYADAQKRRKLNADITNQIGTLALGRDRLNENVRNNDLLNNAAVARNANSKVYTDALAKQAGLNTIKYNDGLDKAALDNYKKFDGLRSYLNVNGVKGYNPNDYTMDYKGWDAATPTTRSGFMSQLQALADKFRTNQEQQFALAKRNAGGTTSKLKTKIFYNNNTGKIESLNQDPNSGLWTSPVNGNKVVNISDYSVNKPPIPTLETKGKISDIVNKLYEKKLDVFGSHNLGRITDFFSGGHTNEHEKFIKRKMENFMLKNPNVPESEVMSRALDGLYRTNGVGQLELTNKGLIMNLVENKIGNGNVTPEDLSQYYSAIGKDTKGYDLASVARVINANAKNKFVKDSIENTYLKRTGAKMNSFDSVLNAIKRGAYNYSEFMDNLYRGAGADMGGVKKGYYKNKAKVFDTKLASFSAANKSFNAPALATQIAMYVAPTYKMDAVRLGGRILNSILTAGKFGASDAIIAAAIGDDPIENGMLSAVAGGVVGIMVKNGVKLSSKLQKAYDNSVKAGRIVPDKPSGNAAYRMGGKSEIRPSPKQPGESVDEYVQRIARETQGKINSNR